MRYLFLVTASIGCGAVVHTAPPDAATQHDATLELDATTCADPTSPTSCGATCKPCLVDSPHREIATCDGTSCGFECVNAAPTCSDSTCSQNVWGFEDNMLDGITPRTPANLTLAIRPHAGSLALAIDATFGPEVSFTIPICTSGTVDLSTKTLTAKITFDGGTSMGDQFFIQTSAPQPVTGAFLSQVGVPANQLFNYSVPLSNSSQSAATPTIVFQAGSFGQPFSGTVWFDDIRIE